METTNKKTLIVGVVITSAIGLFSWKFYKTYKEVKKRQDESKDLMIQAEIEEIADMEPEERRIMELSQIHGHEAVEEAERLNEELTAKTVMREYVRETQIAILEEEEENGVDIIEPYYAEEDYVDEEPDREEYTLKHHPDSTAAWDQYVNMRLGDIDNQDISRFYRALFKLNYYPIEDGRDHVVESNIRNARVLFFGNESRFADGMTFAEVLLYFAELLDFDLDEGIETWAERLLYNLDFEFNKALTYSKMEQTVYDVVNHRWYNSNMNHSFGIFALYDPEILPDELESKSFMEQYWKFIEDEVESQ